MGTVRSNKYQSSAGSDNAAFNGITLGSAGLKEVSVAQTQTTFSNFALATFNNLTTTSRYQIGINFGIDSKAAASDNNMTVDLRSSTTTGTKIGNIWGAYANTNAAGFIANGFCEITGISGTVKVRLNTAGSTQTNPGNDTTTASFVWMKEVPFFATTTAWD